MRKSEFSLSIALCSLDFVMMLVGILAASGVFEGAFGVFFGAGTDGAEAYAYTEIFGVLLTIMTPSILMYFATANIPVKKVGKIAMFAVGASAVFGLSFLYAHLVHTREPVFTFGFASGIKFTAIRLAPFIGLIGYAFLCLAPRVIKPYGYSRVLRFIRKVASYPVARFVGALLFTLFVLPLSVGIMFIIAALIILVLVFSFVNLASAGGGQSASQSEGESEEDGVYTITNEYGSELKLTYWGYCKLDINEVGYHDVYRDNHDNFWISDDGCRSFYRHPTGHDIVCNR